MLPSECYDNLDHLARLIADMKRVVTPTEADTLPNMLDEATWLVIQLDVDPTDENRLSLDRLCRAAASYCREKALGYDKLEEKEEQWL